jgi:hypothetical protein
MFTLFALQFRVICVAEWQIGRDTEGSFARSLHAYLFVEYSDHVVLYLQGNRQPEVNILTLHDLGCNRKYLIISISPSRRQFSASLLYFQACKSKLSNLGCSLTLC